MVPTGILCGDSIGGTVCATLLYMVGASDGGEVCAADTTLGGGGFLSTHEFSFNRTVISMMTRRTPRFSVSRRLALNLSTTCRVVGFLQIGDAICCEGASVAVRFLLGRLRLLFLTKCLVVPLSTTLS